MLDLLAKGTDRGYSMIGVGLSAGLSGSRRARTVQDPLPALDLDWATNRSLPASYGPTPSFSRASTGTYFDGQGILKSAAVNGPRFNHVYNGTSWVSKGLLIEEQRTNSRKYSNEVSYFGMINGGYTANAYTAPDGTTSADSIYANSSNYNHGILDDSYSGDGTNWTLSCFVKYNGVRYFSTGMQSGGVQHQALFDIVSGTYTGTSTGTPIGYGITNVGNGWFRVWLSCASVAGYTALLFGLSANSSTILTSWVGDNTSGVQLWGFQLEKSAAFPTSYIANSGSGSTTRSADVCQITGTDFSGFWNGTEGTISAEFDLISSTSNNYISSAYSTITGYTAAALFADSSNLELYTWASPYQARLLFGPLAQSVTHKSSYAFKANDFAGSLNGGSVLTDTSGSVPASNALYIGYFSGGNYSINGHIARLRYYPARLTNAKLQELST